MRHVLIISFLNTTCLTTSQKLEDSVREGILSCFTLVDYLLNETVELEVYNSESCRVMVVKITMTNSMSGLLLQSLL